MQVPCETKDENKMVAQPLMKGWLKCSPEPRNQGPNPEFQTLWCVADSCALSMYRQPEDASQPVDSFPLKNVVLDEFPESVSGSIYMAFSLRCRSPRRSLLLKAGSMKERAKWLATITQQRLFCFLDEDVSESIVYHSLPHRPKLTRKLHQDNRKLCRQSLGARLNLKMISPASQQQHVTLRELIRNIGNQTQQLSWSTLPAVIATELPGTMTAKQVKLEGLRFDFATTEVVFNNELTNLVTLAKRSITWSDPLSSITRRTMASVVDRVKKCSDSVVTELENTWQNKLKFDNLYITLQQNMDKFNVYVVYCNHLQELTAVLNRARGTRAGVDDMAFSCYFNIERELLPILRLKIICRLLREMQALLVLNMSHLDHYHCKRALTQLSEILTECQKILAVTVGDSFIQSLDKRLENYCSSRIQLDVLESNSSPSPECISSSNGDISPSSQEDKQTSSHAGSNCSPIDNISVLSKEEEPDSTSIGPICSPSNDVSTMQANSSSKYTLADSPIPTPKQCNEQQMSMYSNSESSHTDLLEELKEASLRPNYINITNDNCSSCEWKLNLSKTNTNISDISVGACDENTSNLSRTRHNEEIQIQIQSKEDSLCNTLEISSGLCSPSLNKMSELFQSGNSQSVCNSSEKKADYDDVDYAQIYEDLDEGSNLQATHYTNSNERFVYPQSEKQIYDKIISTAPSGLGKKDSIDNSIQPEHRLQAQINRSSVSLDLPVATIYNNVSNISDNKLDCVVGEEHAYDGVVSNNSDPLNSECLVNIDDSDENPMNALSSTNRDTHSIVSSSSVILHSNDLLQDSPSLSENVVAYYNTSDDIYENIDIKAYYPKDVTKSDISEHIYTDLVSNSEDELEMESLPTATKSLDDGQISHIDNSQSEWYSYCDMGTTPDFKLQHLHDYIGQYEDMYNDSSESTVSKRANTGNTYQYQSYMEIQLRPPIKHVQENKETTVEELAQDGKENIVELEDSDYDEIDMYRNRASLGREDIISSKDGKVQRSPSNVSLSLHSMRRWRQSFSSLQGSPMLERRTNSKIEVPFTEAPLYQEYSLNIPHAKDDGVNFIMSEDDIYAYVEPVYEEIGSYNSRRVQEAASPSGMNTRQNSMILLESNKRTLWHETDEVINSGLLDTMSTEEKWLQETKFEIITSEVSFMKSLAILDALYINNPELNRKDVLLEQDRKKLFGPITEVKKASEVFLQDLIQIWEEDLFLKQLPRVINKHATHNFKVFINYCSSQILANIILDKLRARNRKFVELVEKLEMDPACENFSLQSFLMQPMQRITRLPILVDAILKHLPRSDEDHHSWVELHKTLQMVVNECNEAVRHAESMNNNKKSQESNKIKQLWKRLRKRENSTDKTESFV